MWNIVRRCYTRLNNDKDGWAMMIQVELDSWTTRQQRTRVPTNNSEQGRDSINREWGKDHVGSRRVAAVLYDDIGMYMCVSYLH